MAPVIASPICAVAVTAPVPLPTTGLSGPTRRRKAAPMARNSLWIAETTRPENAVRLRKRTHQRGIRIIVITFIVITGTFIVITGMRA